MMKHLLTLLVLGMGAGLAWSQEPFTIEILDGEIRELIDENTPIEIIGSDFMWTEGPLYIEDGGYLLVSDIPRNAIFKIEENGQISEYLSPSGFMGKYFEGREPGSNGLLLDSQSRLVLMQHGERRIAYMDAPLNDPKPDYKSLADRFNGHRFNSPNDAIFDQKGNLYFTDPIYGLPQQANDPNRDLDFCGVYCLTPSGDVILLDSLSRPNGIALSPDEKHLYVAVSDPEHATWYQYDLKRKGEVKNKKLFYDASALVGKSGQQGLPDGMAMHSRGYLFASGPGGLWVFDLSGQPMARIYTGKATSNCTFTPDEKRLFVTADDLVLQLNLN